MEVACNKYTWELPEIPAAPLSWGQPRLKGSQPHQWGVGEAGVQLSPRVRDREPGCHPAPPQILYRMDANLALFQVKVTEVRFLLKESDQWSLVELPSPSLRIRPAVPIWWCLKDKLWCLSGDPLLGPPSHLCADSSSCQCKQSPARGRQRGHSRVISIITIMLQKRHRSGLPRGWSSAKVSACQCRGHGFDP